MPFFSQKGVFWGQKPPGGQPLGGSQIFLGVKITSKMKSEPSNYSECKFSAKSDNFKKIAIIGGDFLTFLGKNAPSGGTRILLVHSTDAKSLRAIISNICEKIIKI